MLMDIEAGREETKKEKQPKQKKIKDTNKTDRLIARMILGFGLSLTMASVIACGITHPKLSDTKDEYFDAKNKKDAYLDTFEQSDEFKTTYNTDVQTLNNRLIAREIDAYGYESEIEKLNDNAYTEQVLFENADEQTKAKFNEINQKYLDADYNRNKSFMPFYLSSMGVFIMPPYTAFTYYLWKPKNRKSKELEEKHPQNIDPEIMKKVMEIDTTPYHGGNYHPISAEETAKYASSALKAEEINKRKRIELKFENDDAFDTVRIVTEEQEYEDTL